MPESSYKGKGKRRMIITISGNIGSGKTTVAKAISQRFNLRHISAGEVFRALAREKGMSLEHFSKYAEKNPEVDRIVDAEQVRLAEKGNCVVDGRLSAFLIKRADLKIWLKASLDVRARRVAAREGISYEEALKRTKLREESEKKRYMEIYNIDIDNLEPYDVVLNTELWDAEATVEIISNMVSLLLRRQ